MSSYDPIVFFNTHAETYGKSNAHSHDIYVLDFIERQRKNNPRILDVGGGSGEFARFIKNYCKNSRVTVIEPSDDLLNKIDDDIEKKFGMLPDKIDLSNIYEYIHIKEVLHHVVGASVRQSREMVRESLLNLKKYLADDGYLIIIEIYYESYLFPWLTSILIFYICLFQNLTGIRLPIREFLPGLRVNFYTRNKLRNILNSCGYKIVEYSEEKWSNTREKNLLLLKDWGREVFVCKIKRPDVPQKILEGIKITK